MNTHRKKIPKAYAASKADCVSIKKIKDCNSNINIAYAPRNCTLIARDDDEIRLRIWSFMRPPKISSPTPIISPWRLDKVRKLLEVKRTFKLTKLDCIDMPEQCEECYDHIIAESSKNVGCRKVVSGKKRIRSTVVQPKNNRCQAMCKR